MKLHFATSNKGKIQSMQRELDKYTNIELVHEPIDLDEPRSSDVQEIAIAKIEEAYSKIQEPTMVIDAGFYIPSLNGFPRAFVNFALETIGIEGILDLLDNDKSRECEFRECLAYMDKKLDEPKCFLVHMKGTISEKIRGKMQDHLWSKLSLIFVPEGKDKTLAEMSYNEYVEWSKKSRTENSLGNKLGNWINQNSLKILN